MQAESRTTCPTKPKFVGDKTDDLRTLLALHAIALGTMSHGLCILDADGRVVLFNRRLLEILNLSSDTMCAGMSFRAILELGVARGHRTRKMFNETWRECADKLAQGKPFTLRYRLAGDEEIACKFRPASAGGWVAIYDVMEDAQGVRDLERQIDDLRQAVGHMSQGLSLFDANERLVVCNEQYLCIYGFDRAVVKPGVTYRQILDYAVKSGKHPNLKTEELYDRCIAMVRGKDLGSHRLRLADGKTVETTFRPIANGGWVAVHEDITTRLSQQDALHERNLLLDATLENMAHGLCAYDRDLRLIVANRSYLEIYGLTPNDARSGTTLLDLMQRSIDRGVHVSGLTAEQMFADYKLRLIENKDPVLHRELADGRVIAVRHRPIANGGWVGTYEDVTERCRVEAHIASLARQDALTELPNRLMFREKMDEAVARVGAKMESLALLCIDLDNFKSVNDSLGHPVGDKLLQSVGARLRGVIEDGNTIARLGGDEFAILHRVNDIDGAARLARNLIDAISEPTTIEGQEINTGLSIGIAISPDDGMDGDQLVRCADLALYRAKAEGRNTFRFYKPEMSARIQSRRSLELDLRRALPAGEFSLVYQPQVALATNELTGMEALIRWTHPQRGPVAPADFIPIAEETGLIVPFGEWVLQTACAEAAHWPDPIKVAVNLSPVQLRNRSFVTVVTRTLAATGLPAWRLELEITEAVLMQNDEAVLAMLHQLRGFNVRIAMDDFGTGYSSLNYLRSFPFDKIKIDRCFTTDADRNRGGGAIIQAIATLGASLGVETTAEGIETSDQLDLVRRAGCTEVQGYLISRPRPAAELPAVFSEFRRGVRRAESAVG
jgi:diguanylate cyclase (GGDEF)-like protein